jgi:putative CocE/NonD family hydrolase
VALETVVFAPRDAVKPLPMLLTRTPYGIPADAHVLDKEWFRPLRADGYIFVSQNLRGRFGSQGTFVMDRPPRDPRVSGSIDETTDAYDTIAWLVEHVANNNGRVGMIGGSYAAWTATLALLDPHPALKVVSEAASPADQFIGDDLHHNGALRLSYAFEFSVFLGTSKDSNTEFQFDRPDSYDWYLALGPLANVNARYLHGKVPSWNNLVAHPNRDEFWIRSSMDSHLKGTRVPVLNVGGFWDQEDFYGPQRIYTLLEQHDIEHLNHIVIGPWYHDGWSGAGRKIADIDFGSDTGTYYREQIQAPWLARWLHDRNVDTPEAQVFVSGRNQWRRFEHWPPKDNISQARLYLQSDRHLTFQPPTAARSFDEYVSDTNAPVPYVRRPIRPMAQHASDWSVWQALDQRFVSERSDVLSWESDVLEHDLEIVGEISAELFASTTGTDCDWVVKLIDVYPDGYQLMIAGDIVRARFRSSFEHPEPVVPNAVTPYQIPMRAHAHAFLKGHKLMVQIQSSWFPLYDRNPQRFVPSIFEAKESDFVKATQRVFHSREAPSAIVMPLYVQPSK